MTPSIRQRYEKYRLSELSWRLVEGGKLPLVAWKDHLSEDLGEDPDGNRFAEISKRMLDGRYYPPDTLEFFGPWMDEGREIRVGDRILQRARLLPFSSWPVLWAMTEVFTAERTATMTTLGYLTTKNHFGKGRWQATLERDGTRLRLTVDAISGPGSLLFWVGLPVARWLQMRAWRRAFETFRTV
jgi:hypothetical protein